MNTTYIPTKDKAAAIKKALVPVFGHGNVSVKKGTGTASHWITTNVSIPVPAGCTCAMPGISWGDNMCGTCRAAYDAAGKKMDAIANAVVAKMGGFSSYYSDDYSDSRPYDCHLSRVTFISPTTNV